MDEKDFLEFLIAERMGMHHDNFQKEYPPTEEQRKLMELCEDVTNSDTVRENEYYYRAGFRDGVSLDKLVKQIKAENK